MGKVGCITLAGLSLWFNSNDHLPPHFHVNKTGEWEIRIYFLRCSDGPWSSTLSGATARRAGFRESF